MNIVISGDAFKKGKAWLKNKKDGAAMIRKDVKVELPMGLEARPVAVFVQVASQYDCSIVLEYRNKKVNAKSIMGMMSLGIAQGEDVRIVADGPDEAKAVEGISKYLSGKE